MANKSTFVDVTYKLDMSQILGRIKLLNYTLLPRAIDKGLAEVGFAVMRDAIMDIPTAPLKYSNLRGSVSVFVQNRFIGDSSEMAKGMSRDPSEYDPTPAKSHHEAIGMFEHMAVIGFNVPYAARWHETEPPGWQDRRDTPFTEPKAGMKYLESKLANNGDQYMEIAARRIGKETRML
jgi:hypothetical protein